MFQLNEYFRNGGKASAVEVKETKKEPAAEVRDEVKVVQTIVEK